MTSDDIKDGYSGLGSAPRRLKNGQYAKGQSGNDGGRRPTIVRGWSQREQAIEVLAVANEKVQIKVDGKTQYVTRLRALILQAWNRAMRGDNKATKEFFEMAEKAQKVHQWLNRNDYVELEHIEVHHIGGLRIDKNAQIRARNEARKKTMRD